jgi:hypothetical protein
MCFVSVRLWRWVRPIVIPFCRLCVRVVLGGPVHTRRDASPCPGPAPFSRSERALGRERALVGVTVLMVCCLWSGLQPRPSTFWSDSEWEICSVLHYPGNFPSRIFILSFVRSSLLSFHVSQYTALPGQENSARGIPWVIISYGI